MRKQIIFPLLLLLSFSYHSRADCIWTGAGDGTTFSDDLNWSCGHVPDPADEILIGPGAAVMLDISTMVKAMELDGGSISGTEMLVVSDGILWKAGVIDADVTLASGSMAMVGPGVKELSRKLILSATATGTWDSGLFYINSGGEFILEFASSFGITFDGIIDFTTLFPGKIISSGYFEKVSGADTSFVKVLYENEPSGTIAVSSGKMQMIKGITDNVGKMDIDSATFLQIADSGIHDVSVVLSGKSTLELLDVGPHIFAGSFTGNISVIFAVGIVAIDDSGGLDRLV